MTFVAKVLTVIKALLFLPNGGLLPNPLAWREKKIPEYEYSVIYSDTPIRCSAYPSPIPSLPKGISCDSLLVMSFFFGGVFTYMQLTYWATTGSPKVSRRSGHLLTSALSLYPNKREFHTVTCMEHHIRIKDLYVTPVWSS